MQKASQFEFGVRFPKGKLGVLVESIWFARGTIPYTQEKIAPTGSVVAIFIFGDPIEQVPVLHPNKKVKSNTGLLIGPHDEPIVNRPLGETYALGIVASPVGCESLFGVRPKSLRGGIFSLLGIWPAAANLRQLLINAKSGEKNILTHEMYLSKIFLIRLPVLIGAVPLLV